MASNRQGLGGERPSRRRVPRYRVQSPLEVTVLRSGIPDKVPGRLLNLCEQGFAAVLAGELVPGEAVGVEVRLPRTTDPLRARALVRHRDTWRCGMEFTGLSAAQRMAIQDWAKRLKKEKQSGEKDPAKKETVVTEPSPAKKEKADGGGGAPSGPVDDGKPPVQPLPSSEEKKTIFPPQLRPWMIVPVLVAVLLAFFWWRWNRGWNELESGLHAATTIDSHQPREHVPAETMEKLLIHRVDPDYPAAARQGHLQGVIVLDIVVGRDGSVVDMHPLNGPDILARSAMDALRWWRFDPYRVNGQPKIAETTIAVEFKP